MRAWPLGAGRPQARVRVRVRVRLGLGFAQARVRGWVRARVSPNPSHGAGHPGSWLCHALERG